MHSFSAALTTASSHPAFELKRMVPVPALGVVVHEYEHRATGALHQHLAAEHDENVFMVGFRTQPMDSTGIAHVLEHTVLCGSQRYPVRDPFFTMIKRSLNTFMNAFTAADWTAYPFATQNTTDFFNLLSVYLDAVFFPNINPLDFAQEGIRIEYDNNKLVYKGIVFNEMKGACSSPQDQLYHSMAHHLYRDTTYHYNSGGDPQHIPALTHEALVQFHQTHYHPTNAVFMTFGNIAVGTLHARIEEEALQHFSRGTRKISVAETRLHTPQWVEDTYTSDDENTQDKTHVLMAWLLSKSTDFKTRLKFRLLEGLLLEHSASPLRHYLETCGLGQAPASILGVDDSHYEMVFYAGLQGANPEQAKAIESGILECLQRIAQEGIARDEIDAALHQIELHEREITGDGMPYGLRLLLKGLDSNVHDGDPLHVWDINPHLEALRAESHTEGFIARLIEEALLQNAHRVTLVLKPDPTKSAQWVAEEEAKLAAIEITLDDAQKQALADAAVALAERQAQKDDLNVLPKVGLADIPEQLHVAEGETVTLNLGHTSAPLHVYRTGTNGLYYVQVVFDVPDAVAMHPLLSTYFAYFAELGAGAQDYLAIQREQMAVSGGLHFGLSLRGHVAQAQQLSAYAQLSTRALVSKPQAIQLLHRVFSEHRFDETDRMIELLLQRKTRWLDSISHAGHSYAAQAATCTTSKYATRDYLNAGLPALVALKSVCAALESPQAAEREAAIAQLQHDMRQLHATIMQLPKQFLLIAEEEHVASLSRHIADVWAEETAHKMQDVEVAAPTLSSYAVPNGVVANHDNQPVAWLIQSNVNFNAKAYPAVATHHPDAPALMVLGPYLRNGYLHRALREQGGAYGGGAGYDGNTCSFKFYSYRDPRLTDTLADFDRSVQWLLNEPQEPYQLEEAILGLIASMDKPGSPAGEAVTACLSALHGRDKAFRQAIREALLKVTLADLQRVARTYLVDDAARTAVVVPYNKAAELEALGFTVFRV